MDVVKPIAVISGGAGAIGSAIAARLAQRFRVCLADLDRTRAETAAATLGEAHLSFGGDLTDEGVVESLARYLATQGTVTTLVNSAGVSPKSTNGKKEINEISGKEFRRVLDINTVAPFLLAKHIAPLMPNDGSASIINILSVTSRMASGGLRSATFPPAISSAAHYGASKAALHNLQISLSRELAARSIRVNGVAPGFIETDLNVNIPSSLRESIVAEIPMGRAGTPDDVAGVVDFLTGKDAGYITGAVIDVNGGWLPA